MTAEPLVVPASLVVLLALGLYCAAECLLSPFDEREPTT